MNAREEHQTAWMFGKICNMNQNKIFCIDVLFHNVVIVILYDRNHRIEVRKEEFIDFKI